MPTKKKSTHPSVPPTVWLMEDQLSHTLPALVDNPSAYVLLTESDRNYRSLPFHPKRIVFLVAAIRHFARELQDAGRDVAHFALKPEGYLDSIAAVREHVKRTGSRKFIVVEPSEYHTRAWLDTLPDQLGITIDYVPNTLFLTDRDTFADWARSLKSPLMEHFYRRTRKQHNVLMDGAEPIGGAWNFDKENRKPFKPGTLVPKHKTFAPDDITQTVMRVVARRFPTHYGTVDGFDLPVTRQHALICLDDFMKHRLPRFGDYEDAMVTGQPVLFHSFLSPLINAGILAPMEVIRAAEDQYARGHAPLNAVEGFVRQILGWREFVYGIYWSFMPTYRTRNARNNTRSLPQLFWTGETNLNCLKQTLSSVIEHAYSHHIQRLMILSNFATLTGINPQAVNDWFYAMYVDSHDWVVTPNVVGMGMNADGGTMATKPYVSSGAYINRMSDYCKSCKYNVKERTGENACPFNHLYWTFMHRYRSAYARNPRMTMMMKQLDRIDPTEMQDMLRQSQHFIDALGATATSAHNDA